MLFTKSYHLSFAELIFSIPDESSFLTTDEKLEISFTFHFAKKNESIQGLNWMYVFFSQETFIRFFKSKENLQKYLTNLRRMPIKGNLVEINL